MFRIAHGANAGRVSLSGPGRRPNARAGGAFREGRREGVNPAAPAASDGSSAMCCASVSGACIDRYGNSR